MHKGYAITIINSKRKPYQRIKSKNYPIVKEAF